MQADLPLIEEDDLVEPVLDEVVFLNQGKISLHESCDEIREKRGKSVDALFREVFRCWEN